jgi:hypothetical protein
MNTPGTGWFLEFWTAYGTIDVANPTSRVALEVDGNDHRKPLQRRRDRRKQRGLARLGWTVHRLDERKCRSLPPKLSRLESLDMSQVLSLRLRTLPARDVYAGPTSTMRSRKVGAATVRSVSARAAC